MNSSDFKQDLVRILAYQSKELDEIELPSLKEAEQCIADSEALLKELGYAQQLKQIKNQNTVQRHHAKDSYLRLKSWDQLCEESRLAVPEKLNIQDLFTQQELAENRQIIRQLDEEFDALYRLDKFDILISAGAGLLGALMDLLLVGIPEKTPSGLQGGSLANFVRDHFNQAFPQEEMEKLASSSRSKVSYDAQDNRHTAVHIEGLSAYYHRLLSLGHDPILGFIVGVMDIMTGKMTTIDKKGRIVSQVMDVYQDRTETNLFQAIAKEFTHLKSDLTTSMGLPAPFMGLFNLLQFGSIGEEEQTIAEVVQGMYYEGFDFIHFCSQSIPVMVTEIVLRIGYAIKRVKEGHSIKDSLPLQTSQLKHPKLQTMLFLSHSVAAGVNAGKILFKENPMAINAAQWITFAKYSYQQLVWVLIEKPAARTAYVEQKLDSDFADLSERMDAFFSDFCRERILLSV